MKCLNKNKSMEKELATQSSILAQIPWTEKSDGLLYSPWDHKVGMTWQLNNNKGAKIKYGKASNKNCQDWGLWFVSYSVTFGQVTIHANAAFGTVRTSESQTDLQLAQCESIPFCSFKI